MYFALNLLRANYGTYKSYREEVNEIIKKIESIGFNVVDISDNIPKYPMSFVIKGDNLEFYRKFMPIVRTLNIDDSALDEFGCYGEIGKSTSTIAESLYYSTPAEREYYSSDYGYEAEYYLYY